MGGRCTSDERHTFHATPPPKRARRRRVDDRSRCRRCAGRQRGHDAEYQFRVQLADDALVEQLEHREHRQLQLGYVQLGLIELG
jgi:hypothetical protein